MESILISNLYYIGISFFLLIFYLIGKAWLLRKENKRIRRAQKRDVFDPISGETPEEINDAEISALGIESIKSRFSFIKKVFPILIFASWLILLIIPNLSKLPAIYISLTVALFSLIVGVAVKPFIENIIGGVVISLFQPVRIGDTVKIDDQYGVIEQINLTHSVLRVWDWKRFVIPNSKMHTKEVQNFSMHDDLIWTHVPFYVEPECDLDEVEKIAKKCALESEYSYETEEPTFWVTDMQKDAVQCWIAVWAPNPPDAWELRSDVRKRLHKELKSHRIAFQNIRHNSIQFPIN